MTEKFLTDSIDVRRAKTEDADAVTGILLECARWLRDRGSAQWRIYLTEDTGQNVRDHIAGKHNADVYLAMRDGTPAGTFTIEWEDHEYWDERGADGLAGYVHALAVARSLRGQRIGEQLISAAERVIAQRGREFARLDCWRGNPMLTAYYPARGYSSAGTKGDANGSQLFEKRVAWKLDDGTIVRRAHPCDFEKVLNVLQDASQRLAAKGLVQSRSYLVDAGIDVARQRVNSVGGEEVYLAERDGRAAGCFGLEFADREFWGSRGGDGLAGYIIMVATHGDARRTQLGPRMIRWAEAEIARRGRAISRLDCVADSEFLPNYYQSLGYAPQGFHVGEIRSMLLEKRIIA